MTRTLAEWAAVKLGPDVCLLLGRRIGRNLQVRSLSPAVEFASALRTNATDTLQELGRRHPKPWEQLADLQPDEAFLLNTTDLPARPIPQRRTQAWRESVAPAGDDIPDAVASTTALGLLLSAPWAATALTVEQAHKYHYQFYAAVFSSKQAKPVAFLKRHNPTRVMQAKGGFLGVLSDDVVALLDGEVLSFVDDFDMVIDGAEVTCLRDVIADLFLDLDVVAAAAPEMVRRIASAPDLKIDPAALSIIETAIAKKKSLARTLLAAVSDPSFSKLTNAKVKSYLASLSVDSTGFFKSGKLTCTDATAPDLIDYLGAYRFRHAYSNELLRSDKRSKVLPTN